MKLGRTSLLKCGVIDSHISSIHNGFMDIEAKAKLISRINRKDWWHVPPSDPQAYQKRGMFLASTFREAEFWGRPLDSPIRISVQNPLIGDEALIETELLGQRPEFPGHDSPTLLEWRWKLDAKLKKAAQKKGYDAIVLLSSSGYAKFIDEGKIPLSIELNLLAGPEGAVAQSISGRVR